MVPGESIWSASMVPKEPELCSEDIAKSGCVADHLTYGTNAMTECGAKWDVGKQKVFLAIGGHVLFHCCFNYCFRPTFRLLPVPFQTTFRLLPVPS